jgi:hypothetical protein
VHVALGFRNCYAIVADPRDVGFSDADVCVFLVGAVEQIGQRAATALRRAFGEFDEGRGYPVRLGVLAPSGRRFNRRLRFWPWLELFRDRRGGFAGIGLQPECDGEQDREDGEGR